jgi:hypothetical protein
MPGSAMPTAQIGSALPHLDPTVLDCPRPTLQYFCGQNYNYIYQQQYAKFGLPSSTVLVQCGLSGVDPKYLQLEAEVKKYAASLGFTGNSASSSWDPLLMVAAKPFWLEKGCPKSPDGSVAFTCTSSLAASVDGVSVPTLFWDSAGMMRQEIDAKTHTTTALATTASAQAAVAKAVGGGDPNPITQTGLAATQATSPSTQPGDDGGITAAIKGYQGSAAAFKALGSVRAPTAACGCGASFSQIGALDQRGSALLKEGDALLLSVNGGKLDSAGTVKAGQRLNEITTQLNGHMTQRASMVASYESQFKTMAAPAAAPQQQKR